MSSSGRRARRAKARYLTELKRHLRAAYDAAGTTGEARERLMARWRAIYRCCQRAHAEWIARMREAGQDTKDWRNMV